MAQEVQKVMPEAVVRGSDGYLRVHYDMLGLSLQTYAEWIADGAQVPSSFHLIGQKPHSNRAIFNPTF